MTLYFKDGTEFKGKMPDGTTQQRNIGLLWTVADLAAIGLYEPVDEPVPAGEAKVGSALVFEGGVMKRRPTTVPTVIPKEAVKLQAAIRIERLYPAWKQRNMNAAATSLLMARVTVGSWTADEQEQADALTAAWAQVSAIRTASDVLEAMNPIPLDYADDKHWV
jgi:hypothetical protein